MKNLKEMINYILSLPQVAAILAHKNLIPIAASFISLCIVTYFFMKCFIKLLCKTNNNLKNIPQWKLNHLEDLDEMWGGSLGGKVFRAVCCMNPKCEMATSGACPCAKERYIDKLEYSDLVKFLEDKKLVNNFKMANEKPNTKSE